MDLDTELGYQLALSKTLEKELPRCELMSERVIVRKEIRECKRRIKEILLEQEQQPKAEQDDKDNTNNNNINTNDRMHKTKNNVLENSQ